MAHLARFTPRNLLHRRHLLRSVAVAHSHLQKLPDAARNMAPLDYRWAHAVNSQALLAKVQADVRAAKKMDFTTADFINAVEADIIWSETQQTPVMGHPPSTDGELTLSRFLDAMQALATDFQAAVGVDGIGATPLIVKLDFKSRRAFEEAYEVLAAFTAVYPFTQGIFVNADILAGPANTPAVAFDAPKFLELASALGDRDGGKHRHKLVLSVGWTTSNDTYEEIHRGYSAEMVQDMLHVLKPYAQLAVTFPLRATSVRTSWPVLRPLLEPANYGFTLWWAKSQMSDHELEWLYKTLELESHATEPHHSDSPKFAGRTFYDILGFDRFLKQREYLTSLPSSMLQN